MSYDLTDFSIGDMLRCGLAIRRVAKGAPTMEAAAQGIVRHLYDECRGADGTRACALVRFYKTHLWRDLGPELQAFARRQLGDGEPAPDMRSLVLLATAGDEPAWNDRRRSIGHQAIPLPSEEIVARAPMIARLVTQLGLPIAALLAPTPELLGSLEGRTYNVFHVEEAAGSPYIPAQAEFVERHGIRSVLGFGGMMQTGNLFAVIMFSRVPIGAETADRFRAIGLDVKSAVFMYKPHQIFSP